MVRSSNSRPSAICRMISLGSWSMKNRSRKISVAVLGVVFAALRLLGREEREVLEPDPARDEDFGASDRPRLCPHLVQMLSRPKVVASSPA